jgi:prepilin-type N-terminal cleavage/methylation domain-containing protein
MHYPYSGTRRGFTLLEIMVVLVILTMVLGMGAGAFTKVGSGPSLALGHIKEVVRTARFHAVKERAPSAVLVDTEVETVVGLGWKNVGCWHFEDKDEQNASTGFPKEAELAGAPLHARGVIGQCLDLSSGESGSPSDAFIPSAPSLESVGGVAVEMYVFFNHFGARTLIAKGEAWRLAVDEEGRLSASVKLFRPNEPAGTVKILDSLGYEVPLERWIKVGFQFNGYAFYLTAEGILRNHEELKERMRLVPHERQPIRLGPRGPSGEPADMRLDELRLSAAVLGDETLFADTIDLDGPPFFTIHFDGQGHLDRNFHTKPQNVEFIHAGKRRYRVSIGLMGDVR